MKKYTKRLKKHIHEWRVAKNWAAAFILIANAIHMIVTQGSWQIAASAAGSAFTLALVGETIHHLGMSWVETCESIQEKKDETI